MRWKRRRQHHYRRRKGRWRREGGEPPPSREGGKDEGGTTTTTSGAGSVGVDFGDGENSHEDLNRRARRPRGPQASSRRSWRTTSTHSPCCCRGRRRRPRSGSWAAAWAPRPWWLSGPRCPSTSLPGSGERRRSRSRSAASTTTRRRRRAAGCPTTTRAGWVTGRRAGLPGSWAA